MQTIHNLLKKRFVQEVLGGVLGMIVAVILYNVSAGLPSAQITKGLLVDTSTSVADVSSATDSASPQTAAPDSVSQAVTDHSDPAGWTTMRENQRDLASVFDVSVQKVGAQETQPTVAEVTPPTPAVQETAPAEVPATDTHLPNSGPMLNLTIFAAFLLACFCRKDALIAVLQRAH